MEEDGCASAARRDQRSGSYDRKLQTKAGAVTLKVPKLRQETFETAIIERYRRRESSLEEALIEMYLASVSGTPPPRAAWSARAGGSRTDLMAALTARPCI
jgi:transposase-like protein